MEDRLALRPGPSHESAMHGGGHEPEENEDEKVYYGFGVFMGLPLADLKAMKEDFMQKQTQSLSNGGSTTSSSMSSRSIEYDVRDNGGGGRAGEYAPHGGVPGVVPPVALPSTRVRPMMQHPGQAPNGYGGVAPVMGNRRVVGREYDASRGDDDETQSDEGSDGTYSQQKSHSLNFILH